MTRKIIVGLMLIGSSVALAALAPARYDRATESALTGTVQYVLSYPGEDGLVGVHLELRTADGLVSVHAAPAMFIGQDNFCIFAGDKVEVIGSRVSHDGRTAVWAKAIMKGSEIVVLRSADGTPKWTPAGDGADGCGVAHPPLPRGTER